MSSRRAAGLRAWTLQRISAIYLGLFFIYLLSHFIASPPASYEEWRLWVADPRVTMGLLLFFLFLLFHAWVGVRNVLIDYIHPFGLRVTLLTLVGMGLIACGAWGLEIVILARIV